MKLRTAIKILRSNNDYWRRQVDDYDIRGVKNKAYIASRRIIRSLNKYIKTVKKNEHKYEEIINKKYVFMILINGIKNQLIKDLDA